MEISTIVITSKVLDTEFILLNFFSIENVVCNRLSNDSIEFVYSRKINEEDVFNVINYLRYTFSYQNISYERSKRYIVNNKLFLEFDYILSIEDYNQILEKVLANKTFANLSDEIVSYDSDNFRYINNITSVYVNILGIYLVLNRLRNGCLIDNHEEPQHYSLSDGKRLEENFIIINRKHEFIDELLDEILKLSLENQDFASFKATHNFEKLLWNSDIISNEEVLNSTFFSNNINSRGYWENTGKIYSGGGFTYSEYVHQGRHIWDIRVRFSVDGVYGPFDSLCSATYNPKKKDDLNFPNYLMNILNNMKGSKFYSPDYGFVFFEECELILSKR